tara:strand:+ start:264 stop:1154 length:891 start_codon:yes stop_codon:yes gene_type:complete
MTKRTTYISFLKSLFSQGQIWFLKVLIISFFGVQSAEANFSIDSEDALKILDETMLKSIKVLKDYEKELTDEFERIIEKYYVDPTKISDIARKITVKLEGATQGSGVLVKKQGNIYTVLSAMHVFKHHSLGDEIGIITFDGVEHVFKNSILRKVGNIDMAVLTFRSNKNYQVAKIGQIENISEGQQIFVSGYPIATTSVTKRLFRFTKGEIISNTNKNIKDGFQLLYSNATLPGMSGGGVINESGELIGIHGRAERADRVSMESGKPVATGINQAVPINFYQEFEKRNKFIRNNSD